MSNSYEADTTGAVVATKCVLQSVVLTGGSDVATVVVADGESGAVKLTLSAPANTSVQWRTGGSGIFLGTGVHATFTGTDPVANFEVS